MIFFSIFQVFYINFKAGQCLRTVSKTIKKVRFCPICKSACHGLIDACRRHETLGSETKDCINHRISNSMSFTFTQVPLISKSHGGDVKEPRWIVGLCPN